MKKKNDYLRIFGLREPFSEEDLSGAYRALAKLNHPDISDDPAADMRMMILNEGYAYLKDYISDDPSFMDDAYDDEDYRLYKDAVELIRQGFDEYYSGPMSVEKLKQYLVSAKDKLSYLIKFYEKSDWYSDSIDRVCSINKWLT